MRENTVQERLRRVGIDPDQLTWLQQVIGSDALGELPPSALLYPGEEPRTVETLVDLSTGNTVDGIEPVPEGTIYARLESLKPYLRDQASSILPGPAGLSAPGSILRGAADHQGTIGSVKPTAGPSAASSDD